MSLPSIGDTGSLRGLRLSSGRVLAIVGIILLSASLRTAATSLSPIVEAVTRDIRLDALGLGILGMLPPVMFALAGLVAPYMARRFGLELSTVMSVIVMVAGFAIRAVAPGYLALFLGTLIALAAAGAGNVLLPPIVKRFFPDRIGLVTSIYATSVAIGTVIPPALAYPLADVAGWRVSLGVWAVLAVLALPPWIAILVRHRRPAPPAPTATTAPRAPELAGLTAAMVGRVWHSRVAWSLAIVFALVSFQAYSLFAWLPKLLVEHVGVGNVEAGLLLAVWGFLGMLSAVIAPILAARLSNVGWILHVGAAGFVCGYLGLLLAPGVTPWLWVTLCGIGQAVFPACLALINLRTRTQEGSVAVSGFVQGIGYLLAALGPLLVGILRNLTADWVSSIILLAATSSSLVVFGFILRSPRFVEDETAAREARRKSPSRGAVPRG
jgi:CP family cyanate transporter-like MFS transporter